MKKGNLYEKKKEEIPTKKNLPLEKAEVYSISKLYADCISGDAESCPVEVEVRISLGSSDWYKFQDQPFYQELMKYLDNLKEKRGDKTMTETRKVVPKHTQYDYYQNGIDSSLEGEEVNEIIEEIIQIMRKHKVTVETSKQILQDTIFSIEKETVVT